MIYLKEANFDDIEQEYDFITNCPADENGYINPYNGCSFEEFKKEILPLFIDNAEGKNLPEGWVPAYKLFLWDDDVLVGQFNLRFHLNEFLANGPGHIGYGIKSEFRGKGYATEGLRQCIEWAWKIIPEDEIYMSVNKDNPASLKVQLKNGAYIHSENDLEYLTRIKKGE